MTRKRRPADAHLDLVDARAPFPLLELALDLARGHAGARAWLLGLPSG